MVLGEKLVTLLLDPKNYMSMVGMVMLFQSVLMFNCVEFAVRIKDERQHMQNDEPFHFGKYMKLNTNTGISYIIVQILFLE